MPPLTLRPSGETRRARVEALRRGIQQMESPELDHPVLPTLPALEDLFPGGGLRRGMVYQLAEGRSLLWSLLAGPSQAGHWIGIVGMGNLGLHAAADAGVDLDRLVLVPHPGAAWFDATATLADALDLVVMMPRGPLPSPAARDRLQGRLRERGGTLLVRGQWPGAEGQLFIHTRHWEGLGHGHGILSHQQLTLAHQHRREPRPRLVDISLSAQGIERIHRAPVHTLDTTSAAPAATAHRVERVAG